MPRLPAFCLNCGLAFPSPFELQNAAHIDIRNVATNCPSCGGTARIPDGAYRVFGSVVEILMGPASSIERIHSFQRVLREAQQKQQTREEIQAKLAAAEPELSSIASALPETRVELYAFISVLLTLLTLIVSAYAAFKPSGPTQTEIESMVAKAIEESRASAASQAPQKPRVGPKVGRNDPCTCGSGKKYKRCCLATPR